MPSSPSLPWRVPLSRVRRVLAAIVGASVLLLLSAAPVSARPDGGPSSGNHGAGHTPPGQAVAAAHRPAHAGPPAQASVAAASSETPAAGPGRPAPSAPSVAAQPEPGPAPPAPVTAPPEPAIPVAPPVEPGPSAEALPASPVTAPVAAGPILAPAPEPAEPAASPAPPEPATAPAFLPPFPGGSDAAAEAARSFTAFGLLVGLMTLFLVVQGRFTRHDARFLEAPVESEERVFR